MTDEEALDLYREKIGPLWSDDPSVLRPSAKAVIQCVEADNLDKAIRFLQERGWEWPASTAEKLRGVSPCPTCGKMKGSSVDEAKQAIERVFNDTAVSLTGAKRRLKDLRKLIDDRLDAIQALRSHGL